MSFKINNIILQQSEQQSLNILNNNNNNNNGLVVPKSIVNTDANGTISIDGVIYYSIFYNTYNPDIIGISECIDGKFTNISGDLILLYINIVLFIFNGTISLNIKSTILGDKQIILNYTDNINNYINIPLLDGDYFYISTTNVNTVLKTNTLTIYRTY
jgi:hypothetical protein